MLAAMSQFRELEPRWSVYVMHAPELGYCKIGCSKSSSSRLSQVRRSNALRYDGPILLAFDCPSFEPEQTERYAHLLLKRRWVAGEWFRVHPVTAERAVHFAEHFEIRMRRMRDPDRFLERFLQKASRPLPPPCS